MINEQIIRFIGVSPVYEHEILRIDWTADRTFAKNIGTKGEHSGQLVVNSADSTHRGCGY